MSETTYQIRAVAVIAGGLFAAAVPAAQAHPVFALAPPCEAYKFVGVQDWIVGSFTFVIPTQGDRAVGDADAVGKDPGQLSHGHSSGGVTGKDIDVTIYFDDGFLNGKTARFTGQVHDDGSASGDLIDLTTNKTEPWASQFSDRIDCEKRAQQTSPTATASRTRMESRTRTLPHSQDRFSWLDRNSASPTTGAISFRRKGRATHRGFTSGLARTACGSAPTRKRLWTPSSASGS